MVWVRIPHFGTSDPLGKRGRVPQTLDPTPYLGGKRTWSSPIIGATIL